jgi:hypothetical protein
MTLNCPECGTPVTFGIAPATATCPGCRAVLRPVSMPLEPPVEKLDAVMARRSNTFSNACPQCGRPMAPHSASTGRDVCFDCGDIRRSGNWQTVSMTLKVKFAAVVFCIVAAAAIAVVTPPPGPFTEAFACPFFGSLCLYLVCVCMCGAVPVPAARRCILAAILNLIFGTFGVAIGWCLAFLAHQNGGVAFEWIVGIGTFGVYYSVCAFLIRFYALIAAAFGDFRLKFAWYVALIAPPVTIAGNILLIWLMESVDEAAPARGFRVSQTFFVGSQMALNFGVAIWYAILLWRTFRTIDVGRLAPSPVPHEDRDYDDVSLG